MKKTYILLFVFTTLTTNLSANERKIGPASVTFGAGYMSQYVSQGARLSNGGSPYFSVDLAFPKTFFAGLWTASVDGTGYNYGSSQEIDYYFGIAPSYKNFGTLLFYQGYIYPGNTSSTEDHPEPGEYITEINYKFLEKTKVAYRHHWQDTTPGNERYKATITHDFGLFSGKYQYGQKVNVRDHEYYLLGVSKDLFGVTWTVEYQDLDNPTSTSGNDQSRDHLTLSVHKSF